MTLQEKAETNYQPADGAPASEVPLKASLGAQLELLRLADDGVLEADVDLEELGRNLGAKVDGICEFIDHCEARAAAIGKRAAQLAAKASAFANKAKRLEEYVALQMEADRVARKLPDEERYALAGAMFKFTLYHSERCEPTTPADARTFLLLGKDASKLMRRKYEWDKTEVKRRLKAGDQSLKPFAAIAKIPQVKIEPKT